MRRSTLPVYDLTRGSIGVRLASILLVLVLVLAVLPTLLVEGRTPSGPTHERTLPVEAPSPDYMNYVVINDYRFDPLAGGLTIPVALKYQSIPSSVQAYYIVQFKGPINNEMRASLTSTGATILGYINYNAYLVKSDGNTISKADHLASVRWVGTFEPAYKLSPRLSPDFDKIMKSRGAVGGPPQDLSSKISGNATERLNVQVLSFEPGQLGNIMSKMSMLGASDIHWSHNSSGIARGKMDRSVLAELAREPGVMWIDRQENYTIYNDIARWVIQSGDTIGYSTPIHSHGIYGTNQTVTIGDTGLDYDHSDFYDPSHPIPGPGARKVTAYYTPPGAIGDLSDNGINHGTHVGGTVAGDDGTWHVYDGNALASNGSAGPHDGQAFNAYLQVQDMSTDGSVINPPTDFHSMFQGALDRGSYIHTNSWGSAGNSYTADAQNTDDFIWDNRAFIVLFSAGNDGPGTTSISQDGVAKNIISVGATLNGQGLENVAGFSSRGPAADGRIKPDVMAPGVGIWSAKGNDPNSSQNLYRQLDGTSMATPAVAGSVALIREYYMTGWYPTGTRNPSAGIVPSAALVKATLINSAREMTGGGAYANGENYYPNDNQGWGRVTLDDALYFRGDQRGLFVDDNSSGLSTGTSYEYHVSVGDSSVPLKATLVWTDYPGLVLTNPNLVNDLDLTVTSPSGTVYHGNAFQGSNPGQSVPNSIKVDRVNNVEEVLVISSVTPGVWDFKISGFSVPHGPQPYALVVTGGLVSQQGTVKLDKAHYQSSAVVGVTVADKGLDTNPNAINTATVGISSTTEPLWETVTVTETAVNSAVFLGTIPLKNSPVPVSGDGKLEVQNGDAITVRYFDANNGSGGSGYVYDTAIVDDTPPIISNVAVADVRYSTALVSWDTDELSNSTVLLGTAPPPSTAISVPGLTTLHRISLSGLKGNTSYLFDVASTDEAGNRAVSDNSSIHFNFKTPPKPPLPASSDEWPTFHNNPDRSGYSASRMTPPFVRQWMVSQASNTFFSSPILADGKLFTTAVDGSITARDPFNGTVIWQVKLGVQYFVGGSATAAGGVVYACFENLGSSAYFGTVYAIDEDTGTVLWSVGNETLANVLITNGVAYADGLVFVSVEGLVGFNFSYPNAVLALRASNGTLVWSHDTNSTASGAPSISGGRVFVATSTGSQIMALDEFTGALLWNRTLDGSVVGSPMAADGCVFVGTVPGSMYALDQTDGSLVWQAGSVGAIVHSTPAFNGTTIFFGTVSGDVLALDSANGSVIWTKSTSDIIESSPAYANGFLYYCSLFGQLVILNASTGRTVSTYSLGNFSTSTSSPALSGGWLWVQTDDGKTFGYLGILPFGLQMSPLDQGRDVVPGSTVGYQINIKNIGTRGADVYNAAVTLGANHWPVHLFHSDGSTPLSDSDSDGLPDTGSLPTGASTTIVAKVSVPLFVLVNSLEVSNITVTSHGDPTISRTAHLSTFIPPPGVDAFPNSYNASAPGRTEMAVAEIRNTGAFSDVFDLRVASSRGWSYSLTRSDGHTPFTDTNANGAVDTGPIPGLGTVGIVIFVTVPTDVGIGAFDETSVRAVSSLNANQSAHVLFTIEVVGPPTDDWPTSQHDNQRTGSSSLRLDLPMSKLWTIGVGGPNFQGTSPVVSGDTVYYGSKSGNLTAVSRMTGQELWRSSIGIPGTYMSSPTFGSGFLYVGYSSMTGFESMSQIDARTGLIDWTFDANASVGLGTPVIKHGELFFADARGTIYAVNTSLGTSDWMYKSSGQLIVGPSVIDGLVVAGNLENEVFALTMYGDVAWRTMVDAQVTGPVVGGDGRVYFCTSSGSVYALNSQTGNRVWEHAVGSGLSQLYPAYSNGTLFLAGDVIAAFNGTTGAQLWSNKASAAYWTSIVVSRNLVIAAGNNGVLSAFDSLTGASSQSLLVNHVGAANPPALMKGYLYIADNSGALTAISFAGAGEPSVPVVSPTTCSVTIGQSRTFAASVGDRYGNPLSNQTFEWSVASGAGTILKVGDRGEEALFFASLTSGTSVVSVSIGSYSSSATVTTLPGTPSDLSVAPGSSTLAVGGTILFAATTRDVFSNVISDAQVVWSTTIGAIGSDGLLNAGTTAGGGVVTASFAGLTAKATVTVLPGALSNITISPSELHLGPGATVLVTAFAFDDLGNGLPQASLTWTSTIGSLLPTTNRSQMVLQAGYSVGSGVLTVSSGGIDATVHVTVVPGPVATVALSPPVLVLGTGTFMDIEARAYDAFGNLVPNASFQWSSTGEGDWFLSPPVNSVASFYSGTSGGTAVITVTVGSKVVTMVITITPEPAKSKTSMLTLALLAIVALLTAMVVILAYMLSGRRPGMAVHLPEAKDEHPGRGPRG